MRERGVAKRYARALLALAQEEGTSESLAEALGEVATVLASPAVAAVIGNPAIGIDGRRAVVRSVAERLELPAVLANCLLLLAERHRLNIVDDLWKTFVDLVDEALGRGRVVIRSPAPLPEIHAEKILDVLRGVTGKQDLLPVLEVDPGLLGGIICEAEGVVYDGSLRTQVSRLAKEIGTEPISEVE